MVESNKLRDKSTYVGGVAPSSVISENAKRYWSTVSDTAKYKHLSNFISAGSVTCRKSRNTKLEQRVASFLDTKGIFYSQNKGIGHGNRYVVDFLLEGKTVIECYGDYWHCNPKHYAPDFYNKSLHMTAQAKWEKDEARLSVLDSCFFRVLVVWESDDVESELCRYLNV